MAKSLEDQIKKEIENFQKNALLPIKLIFKGNGYLIALNKELKIIILYDKLLADHIPQIEIDQSLYNEETANKLVKYIETNTDWMTLNNEQLEALRNGNLCAINPNDKDFKSLTSYSKDLENSESLIYITLNSLPLKIKKSEFDK